MTQQLLQGKTAIITGGTAGIGRGIALKFAEQGARVAILGQNEERGHAVVAAIAEQTGQNHALFRQVNIADTTSTSTVIHEILEAFGKVDILVNNAGITRDQLLMRMTENDWDEVMAVNVKSCYNTTHVLARPMMRAKQGKIINMSSVMGLIGNPGQVNYAASKAAIIGLTKAMAKELASRNINVNCIAPGFIATSMTEKMTEAQRNDIISQVPLQRIGSTEDIGNTALFLASNMANYITGQVIVVDGGLTG